MGLQLQLHVIVHATGRRELQCLDLGTGTHLIQKLIFYAVSVNINKGALELSLHLDGSVSVRAQV